MNQRICNSSVASCINCSMYPSYVARCLVVAVQPCMEWILIKKKKYNCTIIESICSFRMKELMSSRKQLSSLLRDFLNMILRNTFHQQPWTKCFTNKNISKYYCTKNSSNWIRFSIECFTANFSQFHRATAKIWLLGGRLSTFSSIPSISGIS